MFMRGLRLQAQGRGDSGGNLVAEWVRFDEQDLRAAQALEQTDALAKENQQRLEAAEEAARLAAENAQRMASQIQENTALALDAQAKAKAAQDQADAAFKSAAMGSLRQRRDRDTRRVRDLLCPRISSGSFSCSTAKRQWRVY